MPDGHATRLVNQGNAFGGEFVADAIALQVRAITHNWLAIANTHQH
jgi:hypothetical protein